MTAPGRAARRIRTAVLAVLAGACASGAAAEYRTIEVESLRVTIDSDWAPSTAPGYLPVRFDLTNSGDDRVIEIVGQGMHVLRSTTVVGQGGLGVRQRVRLARGARVRLTIPVPVGGESQSIRFQLRDGNRTLETFGYVNTMRLPISSALIVVAPDSTYAAMAPAWPRTVGGATVSVSAAGAAPAAMTPPLDLVLEPARLPTSWLGYTSVQAVILGSREWDRLDAAQRSAVITWAAAGGNLIALDLGMDALFPDPQDRPSPAPGGAAGYFFGHVHLMTAAAVDASGIDATLRAARAAVSDPVWMLPRDPAPAAVFPSGWLPAVGGNTVPARAYLVILLLFSVLIGPVHHILLTHARQRALIVLTTPLIAALFIVLLAGYVIVGEGFGVRGSAVTLTRLDQASARAATRATVSLYASGRAPSGGLRFSRDTAVFPSAVIVGNAASDQQVDFTDAQRFASGLIEARVPADVETIGVRSARERLTIRREGDRLVVVNGLGATIRRLLYRNGASYALSNPLPAGSTGTLQETTLTGRDLLPTGRGAIPRFEHTVDTLPDRSYLAVLDTSPFWESGTTGVEERDSFHLVIGTLGERS